MTRIKKPTKFNKKYKKKPLDPTPWEELSKNIKGKFQSKFQTLNAQKSENETLDSKGVNNDSFVGLNLKESSSYKSTELSQNFDEPKSKKKKKKRNHGDILIESSLEEKSDSELTDFNETLNNEKNIKAELDSPEIEKDSSENKDNSDLSINSSLIENNDNESINVNESEEQLSKWQRKRLRKKQKMLAEESKKSKAKKLPAKIKLQRTKMFEQKRLERRKELGIMQLPKNFENRLLRIRKALKKKNLPAEEIKRIMREERSKAQVEFRKSQSTQICFNCRKTGHLVANCPLNEENKVSICIKCGSSEHKYRMCKQKISGFPFATCFICKSQGHISRDCPNNEHGIYPEGGKCSLCDSVNHLRKDCPTLKKKNASIVLDTIDNVTSIDDEVMDIEPSNKAKKSEKPKVVKF